MMETPKFTKKQALAIAAAFHYQAPTNRVGEPLNDEQMWDALQHEVANILAGGGVDRRVFTLACCNTVADKNRLLGRDDDKVFPPTEAEFRAARVLAERPDGDPHKEGAYQICRWYRGGMFLRAEAEAVLCAMRNNAIPHAAQ